ncbi:MAG: sensor histidine kinase [Pseudomonadota bacterium]
MAAHPGLWGACALIAAFPLVTVWLITEYDHYAEAKRLGGFAVSLDGVPMPAAFGGEAWRPARATMPKAPPSAQKPGSAATEPIASLAEMAPAPSVAMPSVAPVALGGPPLLTSAPAGAAKSREVATFLDVRESPDLAVAATVWILVIGSALFLVARAGVTMSSSSTLSAAATDGRLRSAVERMREETHDIAHDMGTPLATISLALAGIRRALPPGSPNSARAVATVDRSLVRLAELLEQTRDLGDTAAAVMLAPRQAVDLASVVGDGLDELAAEGAIDGWDGHLGRGCTVEAPAEPLAQMVHDVLEAVAGKAASGRRLQVALACDARVARLDLAAASATDFRAESESGDLQQLPVSLARKVALLGGLIEAPSSGGVRILLPVDGQPLAAEASA